MSAGADARRAVGGRALIVVDGEALRGVFWWRAGTSRAFKTHGVPLAIRGRPTHISLTMTAVPVQVSGHCITV